MIPRKYARLLGNVSKSILLPVVVFTVFALLTNGRSASSRMILTTLRQSVIPMLICWGLMYTMSMGMVYFSAGAVMLSAGIIGGNLAQMTGLGIFGLILFSVLIALLIGMLTGFLYNKLRVPCMVLTIGLMLVFEALPRAFFSGGVRTTGNIYLLSMSPYCFIVAGVMLAIFYLTYDKTAFGHNARALGANPVIADSIGLNADTIKFKAFVLGSVFYGVAAALYVSANGEVRNVGTLGSMTIMMDGFMGMFLAMFMSRFCNMALAVPISTFCMKMITNGFVSLGMDGTVRDLTNGLFLLVLMIISANAGLFEKVKADRQFAKAVNSEIAGAVPSKAES